jgi:hypothetical protein
MVTNALAMSTAPSPIPHINSTNNNKRNGSLPAYPVPGQCGIQSHISLIAYRSHDGVVVVVVGS